MPFGEPSTFGTPFMFTGEMMDANGMEYLRARYYHPGLGSFTGLDPMENVNRYQYVGGNPANLIDPSGARCAQPFGQDEHCKHLPTEDDCRICCYNVWKAHDTGDELRMEECDAKCISTIPEHPASKYANCLLQVPAITDLERLALLSDFVAAYYSNDNRSYLDLMSNIILGVDAGMLAAPSAVLAGGCSGWGRDPYDCAPNLESFLFLTDTGFHEDYQDYHNQPYHFWASVAAIGSQSNYTRDLSVLINYLGLQGLHEWIQGILGSQGASWQDANLTDKGMDLGILLSKGDISPSEVGDWLRTTLSRPAQMNSSQLQQIFPLSGNFEEDWYERRNNYLRELAQQSTSLTPSACEAVARGE